MKNLAILLLMAIGLFSCTESTDSPTDKPFLWKFILFFVSMIVSIFWTREIDRNKKGVNSSVRKIVARWGIETKDMEYLFSVFTYSILPLAAAGLLWDSFPETKNVELYKVMTFYFIFLAVISFTVSFFYINLETFRGHGHLDSSGPASIFMVLFFVGIVIFSLITDYLYIVPSVGAGLLSGFGLYVAYHVLQDS